ncbi:MAG TPA: S53 family peptidase [Mycobacteriales bacterium]|jgi:hypothetical protein|nr:S53 family peptidase [Mycobacteriales bacterium]
MPAAPHRFRLVSTLAAAALTLGSLVATAPAGAAVRPPLTPAAGTGPATSAVTILLKAPDQAGLDRLSAATDLDHAQRVAALSRLLPTAAARRSVVATLRNRGFTVTHETAWTIDAAAPQPAVTAAFGPRPKLPSDATPLQRARAAGALPRVPASISSVTAAVLETSGGPKIFKPLATCVGCRNGTDFRNAYTAPKVAPSTGQDANGALTIATLQFAGWNEQDLSKYAASVGLPDPVLSGQYTQIPVDKLTVPPASTAEREADEEVDLDQETLLSTDPTANQRAYFDTNASKAGYADALSQVLADVTQGTGDVGGGDPKIVALSTSWGTCESEFSDAFAFPHDTVKAIENIMKSLTAAGVTVFAASGDDGIYDCGDTATSTKVAVDYPASSPEVVGVGGTRLKPAGAKAANTGKNWNEVGWSCSSPRICQGSSAADTGGSGGGESTLFKQPGYQAAGIGRQTFTTSTHKSGNLGVQSHRLVPDIADDGDPDTGFGVLTTDPTDDSSCATGPLLPTCKPKTFQIGGTSLASPEAAALFTDMLGAHGATAGVGDIHGALYSAYSAHNGAFRDITKGSNGAQKDVDARAAKHQAVELPVNARPGYDTVTGLGAALWPKLAPFILRPAAPTAKVRIDLASPDSARHPTRVKVTWGAHQNATRGSAPAAAEVTITRKGTRKPIYQRRSAPARGSHLFRATPGGNYVITVVNRDLAGQKSATGTSHLTVPYDDASFSFHGSWNTVRDRRDYAGSHATTAAVGSFAKASAKGRSYSLRVRTGPEYGKLGIYRGATKLGSYDLYSSSAKHKRLRFFVARSATPKRRTFTFRYLGKKNRSATARIVDVDAFYANR